MLRQKKILIALIFVLGIGIGKIKANEYEEYNKRVNEVIPVFKNIFQNEIVVEAVKKENDKKKTLAEIKSFNQKWLAIKYDEHEGFDDVFNNGCSKYLKELANHYKFIAEIFVMDNLGAIVCLNKKTTDYWQGDEAKWQESYNGGAGKVFKDSPMFDASTNRFLIQVSFPVNIKNPKKSEITIGAATVGIDLDQVILYK